MGSGPSKPEKINSSKSAEQVDPTVNDILQQNKATGTELEMTSSEQDDVVGELPKVPKGKVPIGKRRPSELVHIVSMMEMEEEEELEKKAVQSNASLKDVFKGFQQCTNFLKDVGKKSDPTDEHFAALNKLLTDKVKNWFDKNANDEERTVMGNKLAAIGFVESLVDYYAFVIDETGLEGVTEGYVQEAHDRGDSADNLILTIREVLWNYSDCSSRFAEKIAETKMFQFLITDLEFIYDDGLEILDMDEERYAFMSAVGVFHNCARRPNIDKETFRSVGTVEILTKFVSTNNLYVKTITLLALGNMIKEDEVDKMQAGTDVMEFLMKAVNQSLNNADRKEYGFHLSELVDGLAALAQSEKNKGTIMSKDPLLMLKKIMSSKDSHEVLAAIKLAWELAFSAENKTKISNDKEFMKLLKAKGNDKNKDVREATTGALFVLEGMSIRTKSVHEPTVTPRARGQAPGKHLMFSYCWRDKEMVYKILRLLQDEGLKIWIDIEQMGKYANLLEGMANAVENSHTILVCYSEAYKNSQNCRTEADYAFQLRKNFIPLKMQQGYIPDGWLGAFIGAKLYIEFSPKYPFETKMNELRGQLKTSAPVEAETVPVPTSQPSQDTGVTEPAGSQVSAVRRVKDWQKHDFDHWVAENRMSGTNFKQIKLLTGPQLNFLYKVFGKAPDTFFRWCEDKLKLKNLEDLMLFHDAVEKLHIYS